MSIETTIAMKCSFVIETDVSKKNLDSALIHRVPIYKIEILVYNHFHSIAVLDWCDNDDIVRIVTFNKRKSRDS